VSGNVPLQVLARPFVDATTNHNLVSYQTEVQLNANGNNLTSFNWLPSSAVSNAQIQNPTSVIQASTWFYVTVKDNKGCINSDSVFVELKNECHESDLYIPSAFSPNNDGVNDCFGLLQPPVLSNYSMTIYNRWGELLFESHDVNNCWNGKYKGSVVENDSYIYIVRYICYDGTPLSKKGTITVVK
jgi:gliding motility-associated-like protein